MSYADIAAKGPKQSPEDARAPEQSQIYNQDSEDAVSLVDVDAPHVSTVESDWKQKNVKTSTQAERLEREEDANKQRKGENKEARAKGRGFSLRRNKGNPVVVVNALLVTLAGGLLGYGAYRKHTEGNLSWKLAGLWSGAIGAFGAVDYLASKWFFQNKYPRK